MPSLRRPAIASAAAIAACLLGLVLAGGCTLVGPPSGSSGPFSTAGPPVRTTTPAGPSAPSGVSDPSDPPHVTPSQSPRPGRNNRRPPDDAADAVASDGLTPADRLLTRAASSLRRGDRPAAIHALEAYLRQQPDSPLFRFQLAELYRQEGKVAAARQHYEHFVEAAVHRPVLLRQCIAAHTRLMEMAEERGDIATAAYHRGRGLLLLAEEARRLQPPAPALHEELTGQALQALQQARRLRPADSRVRQALAEAYRQCGHADAADAEREAVRRGYIPDPMGILINDRQD